MSEELGKLLAAEGLDDDAITRVMDGLRSLHLYVAEHSFHRQDRERRERAEENRLRRVANLARAIPYSGRIKSCQASKSPARGAPYRCRAKVTLATRNQDGRVMAVCRSCATEGRSLYNGWGGDPNPVIASVEPEYQPPERKQ